MYSMDTAVGAITGGISVLTVGSGRPTLGKAEKRKEAKTKRKVERKGKEKGKETEAMGGTKAKEADGMIKAAKLMEKAVGSQKERVDLKMG